LEAESNGSEFKDSEGGGYYNVVEISTDIKIEHLQDVIRMKSKGENGIFISEYKVFH
jgi:hypothetical protein